VLGMHYQQGLSQDEIGVRLGLTKATINMRLHAARSRLRRRLNMNEQEMNLTRTGSVVEAHGSLVTLRFKAGDSPLIFSKLTSGREELCVVRALPDGLVQAVSVRPGAIWTPGQAVEDTREHFSGSIDPSGLIFASNPGALLDTGIKSIDIFSPLSSGGVTGLFCSWGLGGLVLAPELVGRLEKGSGRQTIVAFVPPVQSEQQWREVNGEITLGSHRIEMLYLPVDDPVHREFVAGAQGLDAKIVLSRRLAELDIWPCIDPIRSCSTLSVEERSRVAGEVRELLSQYYRLQFTDESDRSLTPDEWTVVKRARLANLFLGQPFFVAEPYTNRPGVYADPGETLETFRGILAGKFDGKGKAAFSMTGATPK